MTALAHVEVLDEERLMATCRGSIALATWKAIVNSSKRSRVVCNSYARIDGRRDFWTVARFVSLNPAASQHDMTVQRGRGKAAKNSPVQSGRCPSAAPSLCIQFQ